MQLHHLHVAASSSPIDEGVHAVPHTGLPPQAGEGDAATCSFLTDMWQRLPPPFMGEDRGGGQQAQTEVRDRNYPFNGHNHAAPRTPLESPCTAFSTGVSHSRPNTHCFISAGTV